MLATKEKTSTTIEANNVKTLPNNTTKEKKCEWCEGRGETVTMDKVGEVIVPLVPEPNELQFKYDVLECPICGWHCYDIKNATPVEEGPITGICTGCYEKSITLKNGMCHACRIEENSFNFPAMSSTLSEEELEEIEELERARGGVYF